jgi:hypothetical protein
MPAQPREQLAVTVDTAELLIGLNALLCSRKGKILLISGLRSSERSLPVTQAC